MYFLFHTWAFGHVMQFKILKFEYAKKEKSFWSEVKNYQLSIIKNALF